MLGGLRVPGCVPGCVCSFSNSPLNMSELAALVQALPSSKRTHTHLRMHVFALGSFCASLRLPCAMLYEFFADLWMSIFAFITLWAMTACISFKKLADDGLTILI